MFTFTSGKPLCTVLCHRFCAVEGISVTHQQKFCTTETTMNDKFKFPARLGTGENSVWVEYIQLVAETKPAVNLGPGYPDFHSPEHLRKALSKIAVSENPLAHQYTRGFGHPKLVQNLSRLYSPLVCRNINPLNEILVTVGAFEALYCAILGHVDTGDEVIVIEPFFDCYDFMVRSAGGIPKFIPLKPKKTCGTINSADWVLNEEELACLFNCQTKMIIINNPHNPTGKVFSCEELMLIADLCKKYNVLCLSDEVYEWLTYASNEHIRMASLPDMWERTITVGSAGKSFSVTGWKIGWAYTNPKLMRHLQILHQNCVYTCSTPIQEAIAQAIEYELAQRDTPQYYLEALAKELKPKRDFIVKALTEVGFNPTIAEAGYFVIADWSNLAKNINLSTEKDKYKDYRFTKKFSKECGVLTIPPSAFYSTKHKHLGENFARFCFVKQWEQWERTITVGSAGKTFSVTGWAYGNPALMRNLQVVHQNCVYTFCTPIQEAIAEALEYELARRDTPDYYMQSLAREIRPKRDFLIKALTENGFNPTIPEAGYFIVADWTKQERRKSSID